MNNISDLTEDNIGLWGMGGGAEGGGSAEPPNNSPLPALMQIYCGIFLFAADVAPADHRVCRFPSGYTRARDSERARINTHTHTHTECARAFALFSRPNGADSKHGHLRFDPDGFCSSLVPLWPLEFVSVLRAALKSHPRPGAGSGCRIRR